MDARPWTYDIYISDICLQSVVFLLRLYGLCVIIVKTLIVRESVKFRPIKQQESFHSVLRFCAYYVLLLLYVSS